MRLKIIEIDYGMAYRLGDKIYLNKNLKKYPKLYKAILKHEKEHSNNFTLNDILIDIQGKYLSKVKIDYYLFFIRYPKALVHFIPIFKLDNIWTIDILILSLWLLFFFIMVAIGLILR